MHTIKVAIASDHSGYDLKKVIVDHLVQKGYHVVDLGTDSTESVDYPDYADKLCNHILEKESDYGILICSTGIGMSIAANRYSEIRAALVTNEFMAQRARMHNDSNVLALGAKVSSKEDSINFVDKFLTTNFEGGRHIRRLEKLS